MGIQCEFSCRYTPEQNGVAERKNWSVVEAAHAMLEEKSLPKVYWAEAVRTVVYIQNGSETKCRRTSYISELGQICGT